MTCCISFSERAKRSGRLCEYLHAALKTGGFAIIGTFALDGPEKCSGLPVTRHDAASIARVLGPNFALIDERRYDHFTRAAMFRNSSSAHSKRSGEAICANSSCADPSTRAPLSPIIHSSQQSIACSQQASSAAQQAATVSATAGAANAAGVMKKTAIAAA